MKSVPNLSVVQGGQAAAKAPAAGPLELTNAALTQKTLAAAASAVAAVLARAHGCEHVVVGRLAGSRTQVIAWSGAIELRHELQAVRRVAAAMDEAADQQVALRFPTAADDAPRILRMHAELSAHHANAAACTIPLATGRRVWGAVTLLRDAGRGWSREEAHLIERNLLPVGALLALRERSEESAWRRGVRELRAAAGSRRGRLMLGAGAALLALATLIPVNVTVSAQARTEGETQRSLSAPADSFIKEVMVRPGDAVSKGQPLLTLADEDLLSAQRRMESELAGYQSDFAEAFSRQERARMASAQAKVREASAELALINEQLARTAVTAPFDGLVIKGDLQQQIGAPVKRGDVLLTLAPSTAFRVVLEVEDRDVASLRAGMRGAVTLSAMPSESLPIRVERITPVASVIDGRNVFAVEASLQESRPGLRPGLEGVARIALDRKPFAWIVGRRVFDWLRFEWWTLFG